MSARSAGKRRGPVLPPALAFRTTLEVRAADVNAGGHLGHDRAVALLHEVRLRLLAACGAAELNPGGVGLILLELHVGYQAEAFWGDVLEAEAGILVLTPLRLELGYRLRRADGGGVLAARTAMAFFDYAHRRPARAPVELRARLRAMSTATERSK